MPLDVVETQAAADILAQRAATLEAEHGGASVEQLLWLVLRKKVAGRIALVSSFGADSAALLHMVARIDPATPVIFLDTGMHFAETLTYRDHLVAALGLTDVRSIAPERGRLAMANLGGTLHATDPDLCCHIRKVEPLAKALQPFDAWITGRKRYQAPTRAGLGMFDSDESHIKVNPLTLWTPAMLRDYIRRHGLPMHSLVARGYLSIGCAPCTTPVSAGAAPRAGRWQGTGKIECGIHIAHGRVVRMSGEADPSGPIWKDGAFRRNEWTRVADAEPLPDAPAIVSKKRWLAERDALAARSAPLGLLIAAGEAVDDLAADLARFALIALDFPKFSDGRAFSTARLLREKHGYPGELRAVGNVLSDQIPYMRRVGFDAFEVTHGPTRRALAEGRIAEVSLAYQPASPTEPAASGPRPWLRRTGA